MSTVAGHGDHFFCQMKVEKIMAFIVLCVTVPFPKISHSFFDTHHHFIMSSYYTGCQHRDDSWACLNLPMLSSMVTLVGQFTNIVAMMHTKCKPSRESNACVEASRGSNIFMLSCEHSTVFVEDTVQWSNQQLPDFTLLV